MMSFSKAKLKRFNEISDFSSPFTKSKDKKDKKAKIGLFLDDNAIPCEKKSKMSLFRTPSLPYRLKFRQVSDGTPSKKNSKQAPPMTVETPTPASSLTSTTSTNLLPASIFRTSERNVLEKKSRDEKYIEKLRGNIDSANKEIARLKQENSCKAFEIDELFREIENLEIAQDFLEKIALQAVSKVDGSDEKVKEILRNYDVLLQHMDRVSHENDSLVELNESLNKSNEEFSEIKETVLTLEKKLHAKNDEMLTMKKKLNDNLSTIRGFEFELGKKTVENYELMHKLNNSKEHMKIFEVQHEENLKMLKQSYENEIFFLNSQLSKTQNQVIKLSKQQKKFQNMDIGSHLELENQRNQFEIEKKTYNMTLKNYHNVIEVISMRLKKSDTDVELVMAENAELKAEVTTLKTNYEKLRKSAEALKTSFEEKDQLYEQLLTSSETEMVSMVSKMNDFFNEKFFEIAELKKNYEVRDKNFKNMTSTILEEFTLGIELAKIELDEKQKKLVETEKEIKEIKYENLQLKMKLAEGSGTKTTTLTTIHEETSADEDKKRREQENLQLKQTLKELDKKFSDFENATLQRENDYRKIIEQQRLDSEQIKSFEKLKESNMEMRSKLQKLQDQIFDSPTKTPTKKSLLLGKENQNSPKNIFKPLDQSLTYNGSNWRV